MMGRAQPIGDQPMAIGGARRGRPLAMLALVLLVWTGGRIVLWEAPWPKIESLVEMNLPLGADGSDSQDKQASDQPGLATGGAQASQAPWTLAPPPSSLAPADTFIPLPMTPQLGEADQDGALQPPPLQSSTGHQLMWMAAMAHLPIPTAIEQQLVNGIGPAAAQPQVEAGKDRWSLDSWIYWRENSNSALVSQGRAPTYGASQAGAVLSYRLAPHNRHDPRAFVRAYRALIDDGETEVSAGLSARPIGKLPIRLHAEMRAIDRSGGGSVDVRPSAFATTEFAPQKLPGGLRAELYAQAGYVGGEDDTAFADGQIHVLRDVHQFDLGQISLGAAAWGGAQEGAERVDLGPSMRIDTKIGSVPARLSIDYRERVAGEAEPGSGAALTLSTRF